MKTFKEFVEEIVNNFDEKFASEIKAKAENFTLKNHAGTSDTLYQCQFDWFAIEYTLNGWKYHFNGYIGKGASLSEAEANHSELYQEYLNG